MASSAVLRRLMRARDYLHVELCNAPTLADLAHASGLSRAHLVRLFSATFGVAPHQYLVQLRFDHAKRRLAAGASVTEICYELGFQSLGSFSASFHRRIGMSPRAWQRLARPFVQGRGVPMLFVPACYYWGHVPARAAHE